MKINNEFEITTDKDKNYILIQTSKTSFRDSAIVPSMPVSLKARTISRSPII